MEIRSGARYPAGALSNFHPYHFEFRTFEAHSMEGVLQSFKCKNPELQRHFMTLVGRAAKLAGKHKLWWREGILYWQGNPFSRFSEEYQKTLDEAYWTLFSQNDNARRTLLTTGDAVLTHTLGGKDPKKTILTRSEFTSRLMLIRAALSSKASKGNRFLDSLGIDHMR